MDGRRVMSIPMEKHTQIEDVSEINNMFVEMKTLEDKYNRVVSFSNSLYLAVESGNIIDIENIEKEYGTEIAMLENVLKESGVEVSTEGPVFGAIKAGYKVGKTMKNANKSISNGIKDGKRYYDSVIKPAIIKIVKSILSNLDELMMKLTGLSKRYKLLGDKINTTMLSSIKQIPDNMNTEIKLRMSNVESDVLLGYVTVVGDYNDFIDSVGNYCSKLFKMPNDIYPYFKKEDSSSIEKTISDMSEGIGNLKKYGNITLPWIIYKSNRYTKFFRSFVEQVPNKKFLALSTSDFTKYSILQGNPKEYIFGGKGLSGSKLKKMLTAYLTLVSNILNKPIIIDALDNGNKEMRKINKEVLKSLDMLAEIEYSSQEEDNEGDNTDKKEPGKYAPNGSASKDRDDLTGNTKDANSNKAADAFSKESTVITGYESSSTAEMEKLRKTYNDTMSTFVMLTTTNYASMVRGLLSAVFIIVKETEDIISAVDSMNKK